MYAMMKLIKKGEQNSHTPEIRFIEKANKYYPKSKLDNQRIHTSVCMQHSFNQCIIALCFLKLFPTASYFDRLSLDLVIVS